MKKIILLLMLVIGCTCCGRMNSRAESDPARSEAATNTAKLFIDQLSKGEFAEAGKAFDGGMKQAAPPERLRETWTLLTSQIGPFKKQLSVQHDETPPYHVVLVTCEFERSNLTMRIVLNEQSQIIGYFLEPVT